MNAIFNPLRDEGNRRAAIADHNRSLLVEAGAGSGKTAVMAGRVAMMLAEGIAPRSIAAVTFTELAASELLGRVRDFVGALLEGDIPKELKASLPGGLSPQQAGNLRSANERFDEIACTTIHGFCQRLIKPYPVEANIDPGASVADRNESDLLFKETTDAWIRGSLTAGECPMLAEMVASDIGGTMDLVQTTLTHMRKRRGLGTEAGQSHVPALKAFRSAVITLDRFVKKAQAKEPETEAIAGCFKAYSDGLAAAEKNSEPATLVGLLMSTPDASLFTKSGSFRAYSKKGKWGVAARKAGLSQIDGGMLNDQTEALYHTCCEVWEMMRAAASGSVLAAVVKELRPAIERFQAHKRAIGLLDFDDLICAARDLLRKHDAVRKALARRYGHVLVDEFQDTDPAQTEIFWRLCGDPAPDGDPGDWAAYAIRPGALFLVGDPKQAIYRFRGADVTAYIAARQAFRALGGESVVPISTNFRSCARILGYVNERFHAVLSAPSQPGFKALDPFLPDVEGRHGVAALDVDLGDSTKADQRRDAEAEAVAQDCARMIGKVEIVDRKDGKARPCRPGDIAMLAPQGTDLWRYEAALERYGIPVATQAGKGLFQRQEIQDLIALTRVLADGRDTLAFGALLRGPLVGLTDEQLLDLVWSLPRSSDAPNGMGALNVFMPLDAISDVYVRDVVEKLQTLRRRANSTTPHDLLSQAVDLLRLRPILVRRHRGQAERALSNVDLYLSLAQAYSVRGLRAFSEAMTAAWTDEAKEVEGRPDAQEEAVALFSIHASKGLEWPVVVLVNMMTELRAPDQAVVDRQTDRYFCPVLGVPPLGHQDALSAEAEELTRERIRLWYVAATRARELLVLPRPSAPPGSNTWSSLMDLALDSLPALDLSHLPLDVLAAADSGTNAQTRERFAEEAARIVAAHASLTWRAPSRDEGLKSDRKAEGPPVDLPGDEDEAMADDLSPVVQGGRERGLVIHKLLEEVLNGEVPDTPENLSARAAELIRQLGKDVVADAATGLMPAEIAGCVSRALALPEVAALRPTLVPELPVFASETIDGVEIATAGVADATSYDEGGKPQVVIDWKSDVAPNLDVIEHYRDQVRSYLTSTGAGAGLIVFVTTGRVVRVV